jgi:hypothetical protein
MTDLRSRLLAAVMSNHLAQDFGNAKSTCYGVTAFNLLQNSDVTLSPHVTPELSGKINDVTPSHPDPTNCDGEERSCPDPKAKPPRAYGRVLAALCARCPDLVEEHRWRQAATDADSFVARWGEQAASLGWTAQDLFGLVPIPDRPAPNYRRLSRYDHTGLIWLLQGRPVVALTETTAAIQGATVVLTYRRLNKPAPGPLGDSLDDFGAVT